MVKDLTIGQYIPGDSIIHKTDPRTKLCLIVLLMAIIFFLKSMIDYIAMTFFTLAIIVISRISIRYYFRGIKPIVFIIVLTSIINIFFIQGGQAIYIWVFRISVEGVISSLQTIFRLLTLIIIANVVIITTAPLSLTNGLTRLMSPLSKIGLPVEDFSLTLTIALRFIPVLFDETEKILKAQISRGVNFGTGGLVARAKKFIPILIPLFLSAFRRADELAVAMEARGYGQGTTRTSMTTIRFGPNDFYALLYITILVTIIVIY